MGQIETLAVNSARSDAAAIAEDGNDFVDWLKRVEASEDECIAQLPGLDDKKLLQVRMHCKATGRSLWHIECAADAEILKRASAPLGRGVRDVKGIGKKAAIAKRAEEIGVDPATIYQNADIHNTFFSGCADTTAKAKYEDLDEKEFFRLALRADDSQAAIVAIAEKKAADPNFTTKDARTDVYAIKTPSLDSPVPPLIEDESVKEWYEQFVLVVDTAPGEGLRRILSGAIEEVRDFVQRPVWSRMKQLLLLIDENVDELDLIAADTGKNRVYVGVWLNRMQQDDLITEFEKERAPGARGAARTGYKLTPQGVVALQKAQ